MLGFVPVPRVDDILLRRLAYLIDRKDAFFNSIFWQSQFVYFVLPLLWAFIMFISRIPELA